VICSVGYNIGAAGCAEQGEPGYDSECEITKGGPAGLAGGALGGLLGIVLVPPLARRNNGKRCPWKGCGKAVQSKSFPKAAMCVKNSNKEGSNHVL